MQLENRKAYKLALLCLAVVFLIGVSQTQRQLNQQRERHGLVRNLELKGAPPILQFTTVALGGFRGLIANILWVRATELQDEDKFFEMVQLADWITKLEPHFVQVWLVQAWNMAYNISVKFPEASDRWRWVQRGTELLRDEGLKYNPDEPLIYRELAWFFQHKMGANLDDAHMFYKRAWVKEMQQALGDFGRPNWDELITPASDEWKKRSALLREKFKMDPRKMKEVDERYGPLEWRLPEAHAVYWASLGLDKTKGKQDLIVLRRVIYQSMQLAFQRGRLIHAKFADGEILFTQNLDIIPRTSAAYEEAIEQDVENRDHIQRAHRNFLLDAIYFLYVNNRMRDAAHWYQVIRETYPDAMLARNPDSSFNRQRPPLTLEEYALSRYGVDITETDQNRVKAMIIGLFANGFSSLLLGEDQAARAHESMARRVYELYEEKTDVRASKTQKERLALPTLTELRQIALKDMLDPQQGLPPDLAAQLRTILNLPAPTNAPPAVTPAPQP
jgi:hypothetical protein